MTGIIGTVKAELPGHRLRFEDDGDKVYEPVDILPILASKAPTDILPVLASIGDDGDKVLVPV